MPGSFRRDRPPKHKWKRKGRKEGKKRGRKGEKRGGREERKRKKTCNTRNMNSKSGIHKP